MTRDFCILAISIDGGTPALAAQSLNRYIDVGEIRALPSVFPSSTAPSHASFATGAHPSQHGVVGNRFWEDEGIDQIAAVQAQPLAGIRPYSLDCLLARSWALEASLSGRRVAAIHFPQTVAFHSRPVGSFPAVYCLYASPREMPFDGTGRVRTVRVQMFNLELEFRVDSVSSGRVVVHYGSLAATADERDIICLNYGRHRLSVQAQHDRTRNVLVLGKAVLETYDHPRSAMRAVSAYAPSLPIRRYSGATASFTEAPSVEWTERTALRAMQSLRPHVLLVRYVQTDHVQETLHGDSRNDDLAVRSKATHGIAETYDLVAASAARLIRHWYGEYSLLFSDHGIDTITHYLRPNAVLQALGLSDRLIFSGDSNCGYLYGCLRPEDLGRIDSALRRSSKNAMRLVGPNELSGGLAVPRLSPRTGCAQVISDRHTELLYEPGPAFQVAHGASHGYDPRESAMNGFVTASQYIPELEDIAALGRWCRGLVLGEKP